jgi:hypothetical protein
VETAATARPNRVNGTVSGIEKLENLPLSQLFSGPLVAAIDASVQSQEATVDLLLRTGFDDEGNLVTVSFEYDDPGAGPESGTTRRVEIPLVLFLTLPNLQISRIEEEFSAQITGVEEVDGETSGAEPSRSTPTTGTFSGGALSTPLRLRVKPSGRSEQYERTVRSRFDLSVTMVAEVRNESAGMDLLERAVSNANVGGETEGSTDRTRIEPGRTDGQGSSPE